MPIAHDPFPSPPPRASIESRDALDRAERAPAAPATLGDGDRRPDPSRWIERHGDVLFRFAMARLGERATAEDAVQDALLGALASASIPHHDRSERAWLLGILRNKVVDHLRAVARSRRRLDALRSRMGESSESGLDGGPNSRSGAAARTSSPFPEGPAELGEARALIRDCLDRLPLPYRQVILLREVDGLETEALCEILSVTPTNLWTLVHRAKSRLRGLFEARWHELHQGRISP